MYIFQHVQIFNQLKSLSWASLYMYQDQVELDEEISVHLTLI